MPYCPKCRNQYVPEVTTCDDCGVDLVAVLPELRQADAGDLVEAWRTHGEMDAQIIRSVLESNGIEAIFSGESLRLTHGFTVDGLAEVRILVRPRDAKRAHEIIGTLDGMRQCAACGYPSRDGDTKCQSCEESLQ